MTFKSKVSHFLFALVLHLLTLSVTRIRLLLEKLHKVKVVFKYKSHRNMNRDLCKAILGNVLARVSDIADTTKSTVNLEGAREHHIVIWPVCINCEGDRVYSRWRF